MATDSYGNVIDQNEPLADQNRRKRVPALRTAVIVLSCLALLAVVSLILTLALRKDVIAPTAMPIIQPLGKVNRTDTVTTSKPLPERSTELPVSENQTTENYAITTATTTETPATSTAIPESVCDVAWPVDEPTCEPQVPLPNQKAKAWDSISKYLSKAVDLSVDPCVDFYKFACGKWQKRHNDTRKYGGYVRQHHILQESIYKEVGKILDSPRMLQLANQSRPMRHLHRAWLSCSKYNSSQFNVSTLLKLLNHYGGWPLLYQNETLPPVSEYRWTLGAILGEMAGKYLVPTLLTPRVLPNWRKPAENMLYFDEATLFYPGDLYIQQTSYYINGLNDLMFNATNWLASTVGLRLNLTVLRKDIADMIELEKQFAHYSIPEPNRRNYSAMYNLYTFESAEKRWPFLDWHTFLQRLSSSILPLQFLASREFVVMSPVYMDLLNAAYQDIPKRTLQNYLIWRIIANQMQITPGLSHLLAGLHTHEDSSKTRCVATLNNAAPYLISRLYIDNKWDSNRQNISSAAEKLLKMVLRGFLTSISSVGWMTRETKLKACNKLRHTVEHVAFPQWLHNDTLLDEMHPADWFYIGPTDPYSEVIKRLVRFKSWSVFSQLRANASQLNKGGFGLFEIGSPATVLALYQKWFNSVTLPAGHLNPPFFDPNFPPAVNYGAMGSIAGHVISHALDDVGVQWDAEGQLGGWMDQQSRDAYSHVTNCLLFEQSQFCYFNRCVSSIRTQAESVADDGGVRASYRAFKAVTANQTHHLPLQGSLSRLSPEQLFFVSYAQYLCAAWSKEYIERMLVQDRHGPPAWRLTRTLSNFGPFREAFHCRTGSQMAPEIKCQVWE